MGGQSIPVFRPVGLAVGGEVRVGSGASAETATIAAIGTSSSLGTTSVASTPGLARLALATADGWVRIYDPVPGQFAAEPVRLPVEAHSMEFAAGGRLLFVAAGPECQTWEIPSRAAPGPGAIDPAPSPPPVPPAAASVVRAPPATVVIRAIEPRWEFSPDDTRIATTPTDNTVMLWNAGTGEAQVEVMAHPARVRPDRTVTSVNVPSRLFLYKRLVAPFGTSFTSVPESRKMSSQPSLSKSKNATPQPTVSKM